MAYRTILVDLATDGSVEARLDVARSPVPRFDAAALVGLHVTPEPSASLRVWKEGGSYIPLEVVEAQRQADWEAKEWVRAVFDRVCGGEPKAVWREAEGDPDLLLAEAAHVADLVVTAGGGAPGTPGCASWSSAAPRATC